MAINARRVLWGGLVGGLVFNLWSMLMEFAVSPSLIGGRARADAAFSAGLFLKQGEGRMPFGLFFLLWVVSLFVVAYGEAWAYAAARATTGPGPATAAKIGLVVGFAAGVPMNLGHGTFQALATAFWVGWGLEMGVGAILAALAAGWVYRD